MSKAFQADAVQFLTTLAKVVSRAILFHWTLRAESLGRRKDSHSHLWELGGKSMEIPSMGRHNLVSVTPEGPLSQTARSGEPAPAPGDSWTLRLRALIRCYQQAPLSIWGRSLGQLPSRVKDMGLYWWEINIDHKAIDFSLHLISDGKLVLQPPEVGWLVGHCISEWVRIYLDTIISMHNSAFKCIYGFECLFFLWKH